MKKGKVNSYFIRTISISFAVYSLSFGVYRVYTGAYIGSNWIKFNTIFNGLSRVTI